MQYQTLNLSLPGELVKKIDKRAKNDYKNRSEFMRDVLGNYLKDQEEWDQIFSEGEKAMKTAEIEDEAQIDKIVYSFRHDKKS